MTNLILFACPGAPHPDLRARYAAAVAPAVIRWITPTGASSVFRELAVRHMVAGRCLPGLVRAYASDVPAVSTVSFVGYSAGCWLGRDGLYTSEADLGELAASVLLDGAHTPYAVDAKGAHPEARSAELGRFTRAAEAHPMVVVHSDTQTPPPGYDQAYASTTVVAEAMREAGTEAEIVHVPGGHGPVLVRHGPDLLADYLAPLLAALPEPPAWHDGADLEALTLGERCCMWLGYQYGLDPREIAGPTHNEIIRSYSRHCRRGGRFMGVRDDGMPRWEGGFSVALPTDDRDSPWCAALASETVRAALLPGENPPHGLRVSVRELVEDARTAGTLRPLSWDPTPGSLAICARWVTRGGTRVLSDPLRGGQGHVRCVIQLDGERYAGLGGNEGDRITWAWYSRGDELLRAWIER